MKKLIYLIAFGLVIAMCALYFLLAAVSFAAFGVTVYPFALLMSWAGG
jgi:hypothetical protein